MAKIVRLAYIIAGLILVWSSVSLATGYTEISDCANLNVEGEYYKLTADIDYNAHDAGCINITADDITFDCAGHYLDGYPTGTHVDWGIKLDHVGGITIKNCTIRAFYRDILLDGSSNNTIANNTFDVSGASVPNGEECISFGDGFDSSNNNTIANNVFYNGTLASGGSAIAIIAGIAPSTNTRICNNTINATWHGLFLSDHNNLQVHNNTINCIGKNCGYPIAVSLIYNSLFNNNIIYADVSDNPKERVWVSDGENITFVNNTIAGGSATMNDVKLLSSAVNITFLNCTYNTESVSSDSELIRQWYVRANVTNYTSMTPLSANVTFENRTGHKIGANQTSNPVTGLTPWVALTEYKNVSGTTLRWTNYTINATKYGYHLLNQSFNFTDNIVVNVSLTLDIPLEVTWNWADINSTTNYNSTTIGVTLNIAGNCTLYFNGTAYPNGTVANSISWNIVNVIDGNYSFINVTCQGPYGDRGYSANSWWKAAVLPIISWNWAEINSSVPKNYTSVAVTLSENGNCTLHFNGTDYVNSTVGKSISWSITNVAYGNYSSVNVTCEDTQGNSAESTTAWWNAQDSPPTITWNWDYINSTTFSNSTTVEVTLNENGNCTLYINTSGIKIGYPNATIATSITWNLTNLQEGNRTINITCEDSGGNKGYSTNAWWKINRPANYYDRCVNLNAPGYYRLASNITDHAGSCFNITADNVTLDCAGYTIDGTSPGSGSASGVNATSVNNITIANCTIQQFRHAIYFKNVDNSTARNITISNNKGWQIYLYESSYNELFNITTFHPGGYGGTSAFYLHLSPYNTISNNSLSGIEDAIELVNSNNIIIHNNTIDGNNQNLDIINSNNLTISNNYLYNTDNEGILFSGNCNNNIVISNIIENGAGYVENAIECSGTCNNNLIENNNISATGVDNIGVYWRGSNNHFENNTIDSLLDYDVYLYSGTNNTFLNCTYNSEYVKTGSELIRTWFLDINVTDSLNNELSGASVEGFASGNSNLSDGQFTTGAGGVVGYYTEYINTGSTTYYTPHYFLAYNSTRNVKQEEVGIWGNNATNLTLGAAMSFVSPTLANDSNTTNNWVYVNVYFNISINQSKLDFNGTNQSMQVMNSTWARLNKTVNTNGTYYYIAWGGSSLSGAWFRSELRSVNISSDMIDATPPLIWCTTPPNNTQYGSDEAGLTKTLNCFTSETANLSIATSDVPFSTANLCGVTGGTEHQCSLTLGSAGSTVIGYLRANDTAGNENPGSYKWHLRVQSGAGGGGGDGTPTPTVEEFFEILPTTLDLELGRRITSPYKVSGTASNWYDVCSRAKDGNITVSISFIGYNDTNPATNESFNTATLMHVDRPEISIAPDECERVYISNDYPTGAGKAYYHKRNDISQQFLVKMSSKTTDQFIEIYISKPGELFATGGITWNTLLILMSIFVLVVIFAVITWDTKKR